MQSFGKPWKDTFESRAHFKCCTCLIDVRNGKLVTPKEIRGLHSTLQFFETLTTLYESI